MCGIVGVTGSTEALEIILDGIERLEYRGYDSAGVALQSDGACGVPGPPTGHGRSRSCARSSRRSRCSAPPASATPAGRPTATRPSTTPTPYRLHRERRRRPQRHRRELVGARRGAARRRATSSCPTPTPRSSPTSSRASSPAVSASSKRSASLLRDLRGAFALAVVSCAEPGTIVAARRVSPLIVGMGDGESGEGLLASDIPALLGPTRQFWALDDDQIAEIRPGSLKVTTLKEKRSSRSRSMSNGISRPHRRPATTTS